MSRKLVGILVCTLLITTAVPVVGNLLNDNQFKKELTNDYTNLLDQVYSGGCNPGDWLEKDKMTGSDGQYNDRFGLSISIDGDYAIVGSWFDDDYGEDSGSAYVFKWSGTSWIQQDKLIPSDGYYGDRFGSVSIDGDYALIGAQNDDDNGQDSGSAYVFKRYGSSWLEEDKLKASDGVTADNFGWFVSIDGDYALIGAPGDDDKGQSAGCAYVFKKYGSSWEEEDKLTASDGYTFDLFGDSVSLHGDYALIGAQGDDDNGVDSGSAYVFKRSGTYWIQQDKLKASDGAPYDNFGKSVSIDGDYALIGSWYDDDKGQDSGSAYVFKRYDTDWFQVDKLTASDGEYGDQFGRSVSIDGDYALIGVWSDDDNGYGSGSAYIFKQTGTSWIQDDKLTASDGSPYDYFGIAVSLDGNKAIIGAPFDDDKGQDSGSVYAFNRFVPIPDIPILHLTNIQGGILGFSVELENFGKRTAYDITWEMIVVDGLLFPDYDSGEMYMLEPGESEKIRLKWKFGLGRSTIEFQCHYTINIEDSRSEIPGETKQEWTDLGLLFGHAFPPGMQPEKTWEDIQYVVYQEEGSVKVVNFMHGGINRLHNVRVIDESTYNTVYLGACKFTDGEATLEEGWITRDDVENENAYWQVELVDGA
jgi:hypothetical protein